MSPNQNNLSKGYETAPASNSKALIDNLSSLYGQSKPQNDPNNKYAVFENLGQPYPQSNGMFYGMNMNGAGFNQPQPQNMQSFD